MKRILLVAALAALTQAAAFGRIGWKYSECENYYGSSFKLIGFKPKEGPIFFHSPQPPAVQNHDKPVDYDAVADGGAFWLNLSFKDDRVVHVNYDKRSRIPFTVSEINKILALNGPDVRWVPTSPVGSPHQLNLKYGMHLFWAGYQNGKLALVADYSESYRCTDANGNIESKGSFSLMIDTVDYVCASTRYYKSTSWSYEWLFGPLDSTQFL